MKYYVAGPMAGMPDHNFPAFAERANVLRRAGHEVLSPHEGVSEVDLIDAIKAGPEWKKDPRYLGFLKRDLKMLLECDALSLLDGWRESTGARLEEHVARKLQYPIDYPEPAS